jgi:hypothetical protein
VGRRCAGGTARLPLNEPRIAQRTRC